MMCVCGWVLFVELVRYPQCVTVLLPRVDHYRVLTGVGPV